MIRDNNNQDVAGASVSSEVLDMDNSWIEKIWAWADDFKLLDSEVPRNKEALLAIKKLEILEPELDEQHSRDVYSMDYIPDELTYLTILVEINFSGIHSSQLPENIGQLINLTKLSISHSNLIALPDSIGKLTHLIELNLIHCKLRDLPDSLTQLTNLEWINLNGNRFVNLSSKVINHLRTIDMVYGWEK
jgi:internalin A